MDPFSTYETRFRIDTPDPKWAPAAEAILVEAASDSGLVAFGVPRDFEARCMGRLCKVTMSFDRHGEASDWAELYVLGMADAVGLVRTRIGTAPDGRPQLVLYGARQGSETLLAVPRAAGREASSGGMR